MSHRYLDQFGNVAEFDKDCQSFGKRNEDGSFSLWYRIPEPYASGPEFLQVGCALRPILEDWHMDDGRASPIWSKINALIAKGQGNP